MASLFTDIDSQQEYGPNFVAALNDRMRRIAGKIGATETIRTVVTGGGGGGGAAAAVNEQAVTLGAALTTIAPAVAATAGALLVVFVRQDATGGRQFAWGVDFVGGPTNMEPAANAYLAVLYVGRSDGKWWATGPYSYL